MNDIIDQIARITGCNKNRYCNPLSPEMDGWIINQETLDRFASEVVKECMNVAAKQRNPTNLNYKPSERLVEELRKHFGIEDN